MRTLGAAALLLTLAACGGDAGSSDPGGGASAGAPNPGALGDAVSGEGDGAGAGPTSGTGSVLGTTVTGDYVRDGQGSGTAGPGQPAGPSPCERGCAKTVECFGSDLVSESCVQDCNAELSGRNGDVQLVCIDCVVESDCDAIQAGDCTSDCGG